VSWLSLCLFFWPVHPDVLKPNRIGIRMRSLLSKLNLRLSRRIGISGAAGTRGIENGRIISIPDGEQAEIREIRRAQFGTLAPLRSPATAALIALPRTVELYDVSGGAIHSIRAAAA
jgi:hypothetical protein